MKRDGYSCAETDNVEGKVEMEKEEEEGDEDEEEKINIKQMRYADRENVRYNERIIFSNKPKNEQELLKFTGINE